VASVAGNSASAGPVAVMAIYGPLEKGILGGPFCFQCSDPGEQPSARAPKPEEAAPGQVRRPNDLPVARGSSQSSVSCKALSPVKM
jgi:hypothetical protein